MTTELDFEECIIILNSFPVLKEWEIKLDLLNVFSYMYSLTQVNEKNNNHEQILFNILVENYINFVTKHLSEDLKKELLSEERLQNLNYNDFEDEYFNNLMTILR